MNKAILAVLAVAGLSAAASAQTITLRLVQTEDIFGLLVARSASTGALVENPFFIGNLPSSVDAKPDGSAVFIGGIWNGGEQPLNANWRAAVTKIEYDGQGARTFRSIPTTRMTGNIAGGLGVQGVDYTAGASLIPATPGVPASVRPTGLIVTRDFNGVVNGQTQWYDVDFQLNPILVRSTGPLLGFDVADRWSGGGQAWDWGRGGIASGGFNYTTAEGEAVANSPVIATMVFGDFGWRGMLKETLRADFDVNFAIDFGLPNSPRIRPPLTGQRLWRDMDVSDKNGVFVDRADNFLDVVSRDANNEVPAGFSARLSSPGGIGSFVVGQNCRILDNTPAGDLVIWNNRFDTVTFSFLSSIQINRLTPPPYNTPGSLPSLTVNVVDANNQPLTLPDGTGIYDFVWVPGLQQLLVVQGTGGGVMYRFEIVDGVPVTCLVDFNADGFLNQEDLGGFLTAFLDESVPAGPSGTNTAPCPGEPAPYDTLGYAADFNRDCSFNQEDLGGYITEYFGQTENPTNCIPG